MNFPFMPGGMSATASAARLATPAAIPNDQ
jgi:hypothetical protein